MFNFLIQHSPLLYLTQSLWRDEVYSLFMAAKPISFFFAHLTFEPPFYYLLLHFWLKIFGMSEIAGRALSLVGFAGATVIVILWAEKLFRKHWLSWWLPVFFFFNPMLLYYGMEIRTYGWYMFFATFSLYTYSQKKWAWWVIATVLGFYTHSFLIIVPFAETLHYLFVRRKKLFTGVRAFFSDSYIRSLIAYTALIAPWIIKVAIHAGDLKETWYFPVNFNLAASALGNLFLGYEGTPWYMWIHTKYLSVIILLATYLAVKSQKTRDAAGLFLSQIYPPLLVVIGISFLKPFYVNRYMIAVTIAEVFAVALAIYAMKNTTLQKISATLALLFILAFNVWYPGQHPKVDIRSTFQQVNALTTPTDIIIAENPLVVFESMYYAKKGTPVYLYNPQHNEFPKFVGEGLVTEEQMADAFPDYPIRAFFVRTNGTFDIIYNSRL